jgi:hypothetical protein
MPRYFFNVDEDGSRELDQTGTEFAGSAEARVAAIEAAGEALQDLGRSHWAGTDWAMDVVDGAGVTVCRLSFSASR